MARPTNVGTIISSPQYEPSASGVRPSISEAPEYIGWSTIA